MSRQRALLLALAVCLPPGVTSAEDSTLIQPRAKKELRAVGPLSGVRSDYSVRLATSRGAARSRKGGAELQEATLSVVRGPHRPAGVSTVALLVRGLPSGAPFVTLQITASGMLITGFTGGGHFLSNTIAPVLFCTFDKDKACVGSEWTAKEKVPFGFGEVPAELRHSMKAGKEAGTLLIRSELVKPARHASFLRKMRVDKWEREIVAATDFRPLKVRLHMQAVTRIGERDHPVEMVYEVAETRHRLLSDEELAALPREIRALSAIMDTARGGRATRDAKPNELIAAYQKAHPNGVLVDAVAPVRSFAMRRGGVLTSRKRRETQAKKLVKNAAPDFALQDLDGKTVKLSSFRGRPVLLAFWGYG